MSEALLVQSHQQWHTAVGLGSSLVEKDAVEKGDLARIRDLARQYVELVKPVKEPRTK